MTEYDGRIDRRIDRGIDAVSITRPASQRQPAFSAGQRLPSPCAPPPPSLSLPTAGTGSVMINIQRVGDVSGYVLSGREGI